MKWGARRLQLGIESDSVYLPGELWDSKSNLLLFFFNKYVLVAKVRFFLHIPTLFWKYLMDSSEIICLRVQHYWFNLRVSVSSVWGSRFAPGICQWWRGVGCPHWSPPRCCPSAVQLLPPFAVPLDDKSRMRGRQSGGRDILLCSSSD